LGSGPLRSSAIRGCINNVLPEPVASDTKLPLAAAALN